MEIIMTLVIGAIAGWLGSVLYKGAGFGILGNIVIGIVGSQVGYWLLSSMGIHLGNGFFGAVFTGALGAITILFIVSLIFKKK